MNREAQPSGPSGPFRWIAGSVLVLLALLAAAGFTSSRELAVAHRHEKDLQRRIVETQGNIDELRARIDRIAHDPRTLERIAREDLGMAHADEVVILLPPQTGD